MDRPWCNLWGLNEKWLDPGSTVFIKAGQYIGNEDSTDAFDYHDGVGFRGRGRPDKPFTLRAWPGDEGKVDIHAASRGSNAAFLFWGGHVRISGVNFIGHVDLGEEGRLYAPRVIRFAQDGGPVRDIRLDSVRIVAFQGADDVGIGCRFMTQIPIGECSFTRPSEGWARGIDLTEIADLTFENGEIACSDETGKTDLEKVRAQGLYLGGDGAKSGFGCSNITVRNSTFGSCGHDDFMFTGCDSVLVEHNYFENELHRSVSFTGGGNHVVRYNTFAAWERRRVELMNGGGNALQIRTRDSKFHHNIFYGGGEQRHEGAIKIASIDDVDVSGNEIHNNLTLGLYSMSFRFNDKAAHPHNIKDTRVYNNIFLGLVNESGVFSWESSEREAYLAGETFGNEFANNVIWSYSPGPAIISFSNFSGDLPLTEEEFNAFAVASGNIVADPGLRAPGFVEPDFHIESSCVAVDAGLPTDVGLDFDGNPIGGGDGPTTIGPYVTDLEALPVPDLLSPADSTPDVPAYAEFSWSLIEDVDRYHLQVAADSTFEDLLIDVETVEAPHFAPKAPLPYRSTFYWRVRAASSNRTHWDEAAMCTPWSPFRSFTVVVGTGSSDAGGEIPSNLQIESVYPNPFVDRTTVRFSIPTSSPVMLDIYDVTGRHVARLLDGWAAPGRHELDWAPSVIGSGVFLVRLVADDEDRTVRLVRLGR